jgi:transcriptional regulator with XRE-family HTH domain
MFTRQRAKDKLKNLGWSYRTVAPKLGVGFEHLSQVLNGHRESQRLLRKIESLPTRREQEGRP